MQEPFLMPANDVDKEIPLSEQVWLVCGYLGILEDRKCKKCPRWESHREEHVVKGCYMIAKELINVVETGSAWRDHRKIDATCNIYEDDK